MPRRRLPRPRPTTERHMNPAEFAALRAELERRLDRLRANIEAKRRDAGMIEIEDGVWIRPDVEKATHGHGATNTI